MTIRRRHVAAALALSASVLLTACSGSVSVGGDPVVKAAELERSLGERITVDGAPTDDIDVACEDDLPAEVDATVDCQGTDPDGGSTGIRAVVTSVDGSDIEYVGNLFLVGDEVATQVTSGLEGQGYPVTSMDCEEALGEVGSTSGCTAEIEGAAEPVELVVTVDEVDGLRFRIGYETV